MAEQKNKSLRYSEKDLIDFCSQTFQKLGVPTNDALTVAQCLVSADLRGIGSHGVVRLPVYGRRLQSGVVNPTPSIKNEQLASAVGRVDGDNGLGPVVGTYAMESAIEIAKKSGIGWVGVRKSNHFGIGAHYVRKAISEGMIGFACSNAPPNMAPFGGKERFLGTNPFSIGIPAGEEEPLIFDASSSVVARGKIIVASHKGEDIPKGWAIDVDGNPTTDAGKALEGAVLPFGGPKGSAISFIIDIISGVMTGASFAVHLNTLENLEAEQNIGHVFYAVRTDLFMSEKSFKDRMDEILRLLKNNPSAPGSSGVLAPGEIELKEEMENRKNGIALADEIVDQLTSFGNELGLDFKSICNKYTK